MSSLNKRQHEAVRYIDGPVLVLAGAGSGKTRVITQKIAYLIDECGIAARHIAAITFTNKAAREMKERVSALSNEASVRGLTISTFHSLGLKILQQELKAAGLRSGFSILDAQDTQALIREIAHESALTESELNDLQWRISTWKDESLSPQMAISKAEDDLQLHAARLYAEYQKSLRAYNAVDFDDLISLPVQLLRDDADLRERWQNRLRYLLVDEYQDTSTSQYNMVKFIAGPRAAFTAVGDDDQSIYAWRGARPENMNLLKKDFNNLRVIKLEQNYRSSARILAAANKLIKNNPHVYDKALWSELGPGDNLQVLQAKNEQHEAEWVVSEIISHCFQHKRKYGEYVILYRGNHQSRLFEQQLREHRVPYFLSGGTSFFAGSEIRDIMGYLRLLVNPDDDSAFLRIVNTPRREIGAATLQQLGEYANTREISLFSACYELGVEQTVSKRGISRLRAFTDWMNRIADQADKSDPIEAIQDLLKEMDYQSWLEANFQDPAAVDRRMENVQELLDWLERLHKEDSSSLSELVSHMSLMDLLSRQEDVSPDEQVHLMTLHAAKGLEFPFVYMVGMEEELLPHHSNLEGDGLEEERRLAYVGVTRAQKQLTFSCTKKRKRFGEWQMREPSRFLDELNSDAVTWKGGRSKSSPEESQMKGQAHLANLRAMLDSE